MVWGWDGMGLSWFGVEWVWGWVDVGLSWLTAEDPWWLFSIIALFCTALVLSFFRYLFSWYLFMMENLWFSIICRLVCVCVSVCVSVCLCGTDLCSRFLRIGWVLCHEIHTICIWHWSPGLKGFFKVHLICPCHSDFLKSVSLTIFFSATVAPRSSWIAPKCSSHQALWR